MPGASYFCMCCFYVTVTSALPSSVQMKIIYGGIYGYKRTVRRLPMITNEFLPFYPRKFSKNKNFFINCFVDGICRKSGHK